MLESGHLDGAAIYGRDPVYQWAATPGLAVRVIPSGCFCLAWTAESSLHYKLD